MATSRSELEAIVLGNIPSEFITRWCEVLIEANTRAHTTCEKLGFALPERRDSFGHLERGIVEGELRALAAQFPGFRARVLPNGGNTSFHTEVRVGPLVITQSLVVDSKLPRDAKFRNNLSSQLQLDGENCDDTSTVFAILAHTHDRDDRPRDARLVIPDREAKTILYTLPMTTELRAAQARLAMVSDTNELDAAPPADVASIPEPSAPALKPSKKRAAQ